MSQPVPQMVTMLKNPRNDETLEGLLIENALLHRRNIYMCQQEIKLRAALELATGVPWDSEDLTGLHDEALEEVVARNYAHGHSVSMAEARKRVKENRNTANPAQIKGQKRQPPETPESPESP